MLFDGKCVFCNGAVNFALEKEERPILSFAALQSDAGQSLLRLYGLPTDNFRTFVIVNKGKAYTRFEAAIQLGYLIGGRWAKLARVLDVIVPDFMRLRIDLIYMIAYIYSTAKHAVGESGESGD